MLQKAVTLDWAAYRSLHGKTLAHHVLALLLAVLKILYLSLHILRIWAPQPYVQNVTGPNFTNVHSIFGLNMYAQMQAMTTRNTLYPV